jgi:anti-sigma factor RsiW
MRCRQFVELVTEYLEGTMSSPERRRFEEHMANCPLCARYLEQMRVTIATVGRIEEASISPGVRDVVLHEFRNWNDERQAS